MKSYLPTTSDCAPSCEEHSSASPKSQGRVLKRVRRLAFVGILLTASLPLLLAGVAAFLVSGDDNLEATVAFPVGGQLAYERIANAVGSTVAYAGVFHSHPNRLVKRGLVPAQQENMLREYKRSGISDESIWIADSDVVGLSNLLKALEEEIEQDPDFTCAFLVNRYHSRHFSGLVANSVSPAAAERMHVVTCNPYDFSIWTWWLDSHGRRTVITDGINLLAFYLADRTENKSWRPRTIEEFRKAAVGGDCEGDGNG